MPKSESLPYIKVHDNITDHPKIELLDDDTAAWLLIATWSYSNRHHLDGQVPMVKVHRMTAGATPARARKLVAVGLLHDTSSTCCETPKPAHYVCHDYLKSQRSAVEIATLRERNALAGRKGGAAKAASEALTKSQQDAKRSASEVLDTSPSKTASATTSKMSSETLADLDLDLASNEAGRTSGKPDAPSRIDVEQVCTALVAAMVAAGIRKPNVTQQWRTSARLLLDKDGVTVTEAIEVIEWALSHEFWRSNVHSLPKLRVQWDKLRLQRDTERPAVTRDAWGRPCLPGHENIPEYERFRSVCD